mmetsp:Transcript_29102/g.63236  ORF Transcript_29102/g.63236 Transcript_29102/m.63236 type:complete len:240 (+) Transcript_29102:36-755(+)
MTRKKFAPRSTWRHMVPTELPRRHICRKSRQVHHRLQSLVYQGDLALRRIGCLKVALQEPRFGSMELYFHQHASPAMILGPLHVRSLDQALHRSFVGCRALYRAVGMKMQMPFLPTSLLLFAAAFLDGDGPNAIRQLDVLRGFLRALPRGMLLGARPRGLLLGARPGPFLGALLRIGRTAATVQHLRLRLDGIFAGGAARVGLAPGIVLPEVLPGDVSVNPRKDLPISCQLLLLLRSGQ